MIEKTVTPYEYLVRFNPDGTIRGQHIRYLERITEGGGVLVEREGEAVSVGDATRAVLLDTALGGVAAALARATELAHSAQQAAEAKAAVALQGQQAAETRMQTAEAALRAELEKANP